MLDFLYLIIIYPLYQIVELFYTLCDGVVKNPGLAVIGVSLTVSFLCLPMYIIAEKWQEVERQTQLKLKPGIDRIKAVFKGDEQYMILSTFYKQNNYHPMMALRSSISLLIQIPFFIAAYQFLSNLPALKDSSFFFIKNMGAPDQMFHIRSFPINVLPIAMTLINVIAGAIYSKGHPIKEKIQIYGMALVFLILLYDSPSGLVIYWTMNNIFSLIKNIFYKLKNPLKVLYFCLCAAVLACDWFLIFKHHGFLYRRLTLVAVLCIIPLAPLLIKGIKYLLQKPLNSFNQNDKEKTKIFIIACAGLAVLCGFVLPSYVISSSPMEFSYVDTYNSPFYFLRHSLWQSIGLCLFWPCCIYFLFNKNVKTVLCFLMLSITICGISNAFIFGGNYGTISTILTFANPGTLTPSTMFAFVSLFVSILLIVALYFIIKLNKLRILSGVTSILLFSFIAISVANSIPIKKGYNQVTDIKANSVAKVHKDLTPIFHFSKTQENVIVIMQDRAISGFFPYMLEEKPELAESFKGFTYYPNTASFGNMTLIGSPLLYGGYEYSPVEMNKRDNEPLVQKHNEALKVMPVIFNQNGFTTTITDLSWASYMWIPDLRFFNEYPDINITATQRVYNDIWQKDNPQITQIAKQSDHLKRDFIWFSFFKIMPPILRETIYDEGHWWKAKSSAEDIQDFLNGYSTLAYLKELTDTTATNKTFTLFVNEATHELIMTGYPNYNLTSNEIGPNILDDDIGFNTNIAAILKLAAFFDYLKEIGIYDNTRIILVADHGGDSKLNELDSKYQYESYNPLLLVKDFNSNEPLKIDETFMTNADTPLLATENLIENPTNPFTGKKLKDSVKKDLIYVATDGFWSPDGHNKNTFKIPSWATVHDNIFDVNNWKPLTTEEVMEANK